MLLRCQKPSPPLPKKGTGMVQCPSHTRLFPVIPPVERGRELQCSSRGDHKQAQTETLNFGREISALPFSLHKADITHLTSNQFICRLWDL